MDPTPAGRLADGPAAARSAAPIMIGAHVAAASAKRSTAAGLHCAIRSRGSSSTPALAPNCRCQLSIRSALHCAETSVANCSASARGLRDGSPVPSQVDRQLAVEGVGPTGSHSDPNRNSLVAIMVTRRTPRARPFDAEFVRRVVLVLGEREGIVAVSRSAGGCPTLRRPRSVSLLSLSDASPTGSLPGRPHDHHSRRTPRGRADAMAFNRTRAVGFLADRFHAKAVTATVQTHLTALVARFSRSARRTTLRLPARWPCATAWWHMFTAAAGPPATT